MVEKGWERCREWQEHYWEHMAVSNIRFRHMAGDFTQGIISF
jgi:hypothetical protein